MFSDQKDLDTAKSANKQAGEPAVQAKAPDLNSDVAKAAAASRKEFAGQPPTLAGAGAANFPSSVPVQITATKLRVRTEPNTKSKKTIIGRYTRGQQVQTFGKNGSWLKVNHDGKQAYIHGRYAKPMKEAASQPKKTPAPASAPAPSTKDVDAAVAAGQAVAGAAGVVADALVHWYTGLVDNAPDGQDEGCDHEDHDDDTEKVKNDSKAAVDNGAKDDDKDDQQQKAPPVPAPAPSAVPISGTANLKNVVLAVYLAGFKNGNVDAAAHALAAVEAKSEELAAGRDKNEEKSGAGRQELVALLATLRAQISGIGPGLDEDAAGKAKARLFRAAQSVAPYYSQGRNMDILETKSSTRTCNLTSLAMCLESLGVSPASFAGSQKKVVAAAKVSEWASRVKKAGGGSGSFSSLMGLRMPDFLQLVAIAECANGTGHDAMISAGQKAWGRILGMGFLRTLASRFGVSGSVHYFTTDTSEKEQDRGRLSGHGKKHRKETYAIIAARNKWEQSGTDKDRKRYEKLKAKGADALGDGKQKIDKRLPVETYKRAVLDQVGPELDSGKAVLVHMAGHYTRLQEMHEEYLVSDDPGSWKKGNMKVLWDEARGLGYLKSRIVFS